MSLLSWQRFIWSIVPVLKFRHSILQFKLTVNNFLETVLSHLKLKKIFACLVWHIFLQQWRQKSCINWSWPSCKSFRGLFRQNELLHDEIDDIDIIIKSNNIQSTYKLHSLRKICTQMSNGHKSALKEIPLFFVLDLT